MPANRPSLPSPALPTGLVYAYFVQLNPSGREASRVAVMFNPSSLQYTASNTLKEEGSGNKKKQYVDKSSSKLTMQLVFDTTDTGVDVLKKTSKIADFLRPFSDHNKQVPPVVVFHWGEYKFSGLVEQYKETLDFFSSQGTPLRATIDITLASQDIQFNTGRNPRASVDRNLAAREPAVIPNPSSSGPAGAANALDDPRAARAIASANGAASLRFGAEAELAVGANVDLRADAAFSAGASAGLSLNAGADIAASAGAGFSAGAGIGSSAGAGFSAGGSAGFSAQAGAGLSAGFSADAGAGFSASGSAVASGGFAGLRASASIDNPMPDARTLWSASTSAGDAISSNAHFDVGGKVQAGSGLGSDVGASADLHALIRFG